MIISSIITVMITIIILIISLNKRVHRSRLKQRILDTFNRPSTVQQFWSPPFWLR